MRENAIKNRAPAPIQITAEQILREAQERKEQGHRPPRRNIADHDELIEYRMTQRKNFEDSLRRQRQHIGTWIKYASWEEQQHEFQRARSIYERALDVDYRSSTVWLKYAEMEMRHQFINHARNIWDRAVTLLPRIAQFWYKYAFMEEMVGNIAGARQIFERWMEWHPEDQAWYSYIKFEMRQKDMTRARKLYERYLNSHFSEKAFLKYAQWEEKQQHQIALARKLYERAMEELRDDERTESFYIAFAAFEERCKEYERARAIYKYALDVMDREKATDLYQAFIRFEKQHGDKKRIEDVVTCKRRIVYEKQVMENCYDYDSWIEYLKLEEARIQEEEKDVVIARVRELYERAIAQVPPIAEKRYWRRYIYLWIKYAIFEELVANSDRVEQVYSTCVGIIPHKTFTFSKIWILYAKYCIRQRDVVKARKILGQSIGMCPKKKLFRQYIELELMMGEIERCRTLYEKFVLFDASNCEIWQKYAALEQQIGELERARGIYELAIRQPVLDMPEMIWKAYIDFETENGEIEKTRALYERLLERTKHVKVWLSYAQFEQAQNGNASDIFQRAIAYLKEQQQVLNDSEAPHLLYEKKAERALCLKTWLDMEKNAEVKNMDEIARVERMQPRKTIKQRIIYAEDGTELGTEEYADYVFADDEQAQSHLKLLQAAQAWKQSKMTATRA